MKSPEIKQSSDYTRFICHEYQQPMSNKHVQDIADSIQKNGYFHSMPISVFVEGTKYRVIDGHHRLAACKSLKLPVVFVVEPEQNAQSIGVINTLVRKWKASSFIEMYAAQGNRHYATLLRYINDGFKMQQAASLLAGESAHSYNCGKLVACGKFTVKTTATIDAIASLWKRTDGISPIREKAPDITHRPFVEALSMLLNIPRFDLDTLGKRLLNNPRMVTKCADRGQALLLLEEIYNFRAGVKLPLAHLAKEATRTRSVAAPTK